MFGINLNIQLRIKLTEYKNIIGNHKVTIQFILELKKLRILKLEKENSKAIDKRT